MTEKWIILIMQDENVLVPKNPITDVEDIAACNDDGVLLIFNSLDSAHEYQNEHCINGRCVELPLY